MFLLYASKNLLTVRQREPITSGSVNVYTVRFEFSPDWEGLTRVAVFQAHGAQPKAVELDDTNTCTIPWEVLEHYAPNTQLYAEVYGKRGEEVVLPTIWASLGTILKGAVAGEAARPPTPDLWEQELARKGDALNYDGLNLSLMAGDKPLSTVKIAGGEGGVLVPGPEGPPGPQGEPGKDGFSPTVTTTTISDGTTVTITDVNGAHSFNVLNGLDGKDGERGPQGEMGPPGPAGSGVDLTAGEGVSIENDTVSVTTPVEGIYTQDEFDKLPKEKQNKGLYVIQNSDGGSSGETIGDVYSTEEIKIGTWIDGRPVYRVFVTKDIVVKKDTTLYVNLLENVEYRLVKATGYVDCGWGGRYVLPFVEKTSASAMTCFAVGQTYSPNGAIWLSIYYPDPLSATVMCWIDYIKTTDPEVTT